jgi:hypothetical protein
MILIDSGQLTIDNGQWTMTMDNDKRCQPEGKRRILFLLRFRSKVYLIINQRSERFEKRKMKDE